MKKRQQIEVDTKSICGINFYQLSRLIGISPQLLTDVLNGKRKPHFEAMQKFSKFTGHLIEEYLTENNG
jgi:prephenate dehydrogenase